MPARPSRHRSRLTTGPRAATLLGAAGLAAVLVAGPASASTPTPSTPVPSSAPADVAPTGEACPEGEGATILVDPQGLTGGELDGPTAACAPEAVDGLQALTEAGFEATTEDSVGAGYVCTIGGVPTPEQGDCVNDGYWAYYYAPRDGEWTASEVGAADRVPEQGGVEAWSWTVLSGDSIAGTPPRVDPAAVEALPVAGAQESPEPSPTTAPSASTAPSATASEGTSPEGDASADVGADIAEDGPPVVTIAVVAVLVVLVVVGLLVARRRRADVDGDGRGGSDAR